MVNVRFWQQSDLPDLERMMVQLTWGITPPDDRVSVGYDRVAGAAVRGLRQILGAPGATAVVAESGGRPVGFMLVCVQQDDRTGEWLGYLADIFLEPAFRGQGLAAAMERMGCEHLRRMGLRTAYAWIHANNPQGQAAARRFGLQLRGIVLSKQVGAAGTR